MKTISRLGVIVGCSMLLLSCSDSGRSQAEAAEHAALLTRIDALEAETEIRNKLQSYMDVLSASDWDNFVTYFTRDAVLVMTEGNRQGREDIKERMAGATARFASAAVGRPVFKRADLLSILKVEVHGETADVKSRFTFLSQTAQGGFEVTGSGLYIDTWAREDGEWLIAQREVDYDLLRIAAPANTPQ